MKIYRVTLSRVYKIPEELIEKRLKDNLFYDEISDRNDKKLFKETAEEIARDYLSNEMSEFPDNTYAFVLAKIKIINK